MEKIVSDLTVVGGGVSGMTAALAAARHGLKVALVQDREVLGGNISSECEAGFGSGSVNASYYARESGISDEIKLRLYHANPRYIIKEDYYLIDDTLQQIIMEEPNIRLFLGTAVYEVETEETDGKRRVVSATGFCSRAQKHYTFHSPLFVDASGDGIVAFKSGAEFRMGREAKSEYGEPKGREVADDGKMGSCILFNVGKANHPVPFVKPDYAYDLEEDDLLKYFDRPETGRRLPTQFDGMTGLWWLSVGGTQDTIGDSYEIDIELKKLLYGYWNYVKNSGKYPQSANYYLRWIAPFGAKRESRRFYGDYVLTQNDICQGIRHEDDVSTGGWSVDCHDPAGIYGMEPTSIFADVPAMYNIPYRCMYSRNVENLFLAGRIVSASHLALGSLRVVQTLAAMAQAVGNAAALCKEHNCLPRDIYTHHRDTLRYQLQRDGQYIIGYPEDCGLASDAKVTASSTRKLENMDLDHPLPLTDGYCLPIPTENGVLDSLEIYVRNDAKEDRVLRYEIWENDIVHTYRHKTQLMTGSVTVPLQSAGWQKLPVNLTGIAGKKAYVMIQAAEDLSLYGSHIHVTGVPCFRVVNRSLRRMEGSIAFRNVLPEQNLYRPENVVNGTFRPVGVPNVWVAESNREECLTLTFPETKTVREIDLTFNAELWNQSVALGEPVKHMVKSFDVVLYQGDQEVKRIPVREHFQHHYRTAFEAVACDRIDLEIHENYGSAYIEVFGVKVF